MLTLQIRELKYNGYKKQRKFGSTGVLVKSDIK